MLHLIANCKYTPNHTFTDLPFFSNRYLLKHVINNDNIEKWEDHAVSAIVSGHFDLFEYTLPRCKQYQDIKQLVLLTGDALFVNHFQKVTSVEILEKNVKN